MTSTAPTASTNPALKGPAGNEITQWEVALSRAASELKRYRGNEVAIIASASFTNEELFLTRRLSEALGTTLLDIIPHNAAGDKILLSADRNANTAGARLMGVTGGVPGSLLGLIASGLQNRTVKALIVLGEDATTVLGEEIANAQLIVAINILPNGTTKLATFVLPSCRLRRKTRLDDQQERPPPAPQPRHPAPGRRPRRLGDHPRPPPRRLRRRTAFT